MPKLRLNVTHTHAGKAYPAGETLDVDDHTARWLIARDIAVLALSGSAAPLSATEPPAEPAPQPAISTRSLKSPKE